MKVAQGLGVPMKRWAEGIEDGAFQQIRNVARLPFAFRHVAIMPDCHQGYGMPIGGVLAAKGAIVPNAVGVDIGCGMCAVQTGLESITRSELEKLVICIHETIPVGFKWHEEENWDAMPILPSEQLPIVERNHSKAAKQIGTLGGGNHFIEIQAGSDGYVWIMIHSGSRNLGKQVADWYNKLAINRNELWHSSVPKKWELAFFPMTTPEAILYRREMEYCVNFALANREEMMRVVCDLFPHDVFGDPINIAHNYAATENHFGQNVMVHRKGATRAREGELGIIPGSQGTHSYVVRGKGNPESFMSCSHGAGRRMGRKQAIRELVLEDEQAKLDGIIHSVHTDKDLDEAPGAYKDIGEVMRNQEDLVEIVVELTPLAVIKG